MPETQQQDPHYTQQLRESMRRHVLSSGYVLTINGLSDSLLNHDGRSFKEVATLLARALQQDFVDSLKPEYRDKAAKALATDAENNPERYLTLAMEVIEAHQRAHAPASFAKKVKPRAERAVADGPGGLTRERR